MEKVARHEKSIYFPDAGYVHCVGCRTKLKGRSRLLLLKASRTGIDPATKKRSSSWMSSTISGRFMPI